MQFKKHFVGKEIAGREHSFPLKIQGNNKKLWALVVNKRRDSGQGNKQIQFYSKDNRHGNNLALLFLILSWSSCAVKLYASFISSQPCDIGWKSLRICFLLWEGIIGEKEK
jgi:hypothetical protein